MALVPACVHGLGDHALLARVPDGGRRGAEGQSSGVVAGCAREGLPASPQLCSLVTGGRQVSLPPRTAVMTASVCRGGGSSLSLLTNSALCNWLSNAGTEILVEPPPRATRRTEIPATSGSVSCWQRPKLWNLHLCPREGRGERAAVAWPSRTPAGGLTRRSDFSWTGSTGPVPRRTGRLVSPPTP